MLLYQCRSRHQVWCSRISRLLPSLQWNRNPFLQLHKVRVWHSSYAFYAFGWMTNKTVGIEKMTICRRFKGLHSLYIIAQAKNEFLYIHLCIYDYVCKPAFFVLCLLMTQMTQMTEHYTCRRFSWAQCFFFLPVFFCLKGNEIIQTNWNSLKKRYAWRIFEIGRNRIEKAQTRTKALF